MDARLENAFLNKQRLINILKTTNQKLDTLTFISWVATDYPDCNTEATNISPFIEEYSAISNEADILNDNHDLSELFQVKMKKFLLKCLKNEIINSSGKPYHGGFHLQELRDCFKELEQLTQNRLDDELNDVIKRKKSYTEKELDGILQEQTTLLNDLESKLNQIENERNLKSENNFNLIKYYENEISKIQLEAQVIIEQTKKKCENELRTTNLKFSQEEEELNLEMYKIETELRKLRLVHDLSETQLKSIKISLQDEISELNKRDDLRRIRKQETMEKPGTEFKQLLEQASLLHDQTIRLKRQYKSILDERESKRIEEERLAEEFFKKSSAATLIQTRWRGYQARLKLRAKFRKWKRSKKAKLTKMDSLSKVIQTLVRQQKIRRDSQDVLDETCFDIDATVS